MSRGFEPIRSYQRIFRPERRIYQIDGRPLPVPGGVPLRWLAYATVTLLGTIAVASGSSTAVLGAAAVGAIVGNSVGGREGAAVAGIGAGAASWICGLVLGLLDWPLRLIVIPAVLATLGTQATPDGRRADRFALTWLSLRLAPRRRSLGRACPLAGVHHRHGGELWTAPDESAPRLRRARVRGPAILSFAEPLSVRRGRFCKGRLTASSARGPRRARALVASRLAVAEGEMLEVRP